RRYLDFRTEAPPDRASTRPSGWPQPTIRESIMVEVSLLERADQQRVARLSHLSTVLGLRSAIARHQVALSTAIAVLNLSISTLINIEGAAGVEGALRAARSLLNEAALKLDEAAYQERRA